MKETKQNTTHRKNNDISNRIMVLYFIYVSKNISQATKYIFLVS